MKSVLLCCSAFSLLTLGVVWGDDQDGSPETRPVVVASFSGYAELNQNLQYAASLTGNPGLAADVKRLLLPAMQGDVLAGLDAARPWGASLSITDDGLRFPFRVFLPVDDFGKLRTALGAEDESDEAGDGVYAIERDNSTFFIRQKGAWGYISRQRIALTQLPDDPLQQLHGLEGQYDLALSVNLQNIPVVLRTMAAGLIKRGFAARPPIAGSDDDEQSEPTPQIAGSAAEALIKSLSTLDRVTVGLKLDRTANRTLLDLEVTTSRSGKAVERQTAGVGEPLATRLTGVLSPNAIFSLLVDQPLADANRRSLKNVLSSFRDELPAVFDRAASLDDEHKAKGKKLAGSLLELLEMTVERGRIDVGLAVNGTKSPDTFGDIIDQAVRETFPNHIQETIIGTGHLNLVACGRTSEGPELEEIVMQIVSMAAEAAGDDAPELNVEQYQGHRFHTFSIMAPQTMRADWPLRTLRNLLGNPLKFVVAFGEDTFYMAVGENAADAIKQVIDQSFETPGQKRPPVAASLSLAKLWSSLTLPTRDSLAAKISDLLRQSGNDHVNLTVEPVDGGVRCRIEGEASVTRLLAFGLGSAAGASVNLEPPSANGPTSNGVAANPDRRFVMTTTTTIDDGGTVTTTRTETGDGGRSLRREVNVTRRRIPGDQPPRPNGGDIDSDEEQGSKPDTTLRTWSSKGDKYQVRARFIEMQGDLVRLEREDGARVTIAIDKLSEADQKLARELAELAEEENPFVVKGHND